MSTPISLFYWLLVYNIMFYHRLRGEIMKKILNKEIGLRVRRLRENKGLSREKFSENIDITPQFLAEIENGNKGMSFATLIKVCNFLSGSTDYIIVGETQNDLSKIMHILSNMDKDYIPFAESILETYALSVKKSTQHN